MINKEAATIIMKSFVRELSKVAASQREVARTAYFNPKKRPVKEVKKVMPAVIKRDKDGNQTDYYGNPIDTRPMPAVIKINKDGQKTDYRGNVLEGGMMPLKGMKKKGAFGIFKSLRNLGNLKGLATISKKLAPQADEFAKAIRQAKIDAHPRYDGSKFSTPPYMTKAERKAEFINKYLGNQGGRFRIPSMDNPPLPNKAKNTTKQKDMFDVDLDETSPQGFKNLFDDTSDMILD